MRFIMENKGVKLITDIWNIVITSFTHSFTTLKHNISTASNPIILTAI